MRIKRIIGGSLESNGYIIYTNASDTCFIIDPGYNAQAFVNYMEGERLKCEGILLTHNHYDHVGAADKLAMDVAAKVYMHANDAQDYKGKVDVILYGGEKLNTGQLEIEVIHTPGHSSGSVCFAEWDAKAIFTGDTVFNVDLGRTDLKSGSEYQMVASIRDIVDRWSNDITIYPGHGDPATMKWVREHNHEYEGIVKK